jgi:hypothetical protein
MKCNKNKPNSKLFSYTSQYVLNMFQNMDEKIDFNNKNMSRFNFLLKDMSITKYAIFSRKTSRTSGKASFNYLLKKNIIN